MKNLLYLPLVLSTITIARAQSLPSEMYTSADGHMLLLGGQPFFGLYDQSQVRRINLNFSQPDFWKQLEDNYWDWGKKELPASMTVDGITYPNVGVRFKGQSTFQNTPSDSKKKSFSISLDFQDPNQEIMGYKSLNLHNGFDDPTFIREVLYETIIRNHIPGARCAYTELFINGESWGLYPSIQQHDKKFFKQWYLSAKGTSWRGDRPSGKWTPYGDGTSALNYLGADTSLYQEQYTLKFTGKTDPWYDLVHTCDVLNNTPISDLPYYLPSVLDVDRTLWFLASEILFSDDDSYVQKGRVDYFFYWEKETGRIAPQEYDGNTVMKTNFYNWSPFHHADNLNYPLLNRILQVPEYRQRYLAHLRTLIKEYFDPAGVGAMIDAFAAQIDPVVQSDPKKLYSYSDFQNELTALKNFIVSRKDFLNNHPEVNEAAPLISETAWYANGNAWEVPVPMNAATARARVSSPAHRVNLYYSAAVMGNFTQAQMFDDGLHDDVNAGDGLYGASIPGQPAGTWVRFYIEAIANNSARTAAYDPAGAEHNVYAYVSGVVPALETGNEDILFSIYPNPSSGMFAIHAPRGFSSLEITNPLGEVVYAGKNLRDLSVIDLSTTPKGLYFVRAGEGMNRQVKKLLLQ